MVSSLPLPHAQVESTVRDRNVERNSEQRALEMSSHIIGPLIRVCIWEVLWCDPVQRHLHINTDVRICVLI